jgi:predicted unusual protein kinase regulating ubiquinone biosynthesis (AarF/ABC1/UbiB family)
MEAAAAAQEQEVAGAGRKPRSLSMAKRRAQFSEVSRDLNRIFYAFPFAVPEYFALITRALIVLEGIALTGDANFDIFRASYPYATRHAASLFGVSQLATMLGEAAMTR